MTTARPVQFDLGGMFQRPPRATLVLMVLTGVVSVLGMIDGGSFGTGTLVRQIVFSPTSVLDSFKLWTPVTFLFFVPSPFMLLLHVGLTLWLFAAPLERQWGARRFLFYFFATSSGTALVLTGLSLLLGPLRATVFLGSWVVGSSVVLGWVLMNWYGTVYFFIIPVRAPTLLLLWVGLAALEGLMGEWRRLLAILLAMGIGYLLLNKRGASPRRLWLYLRAFWIERKMKQRSRRLHVVPPPPDQDGDGKPPRYLN